MKIRSFALLFVTLSPSAALAYVPMQSQWDPSSLPVGYRINLNSAPPEIGSSGARTAVEAGFASWAAPACSAFRTTNLGTTNLAAGDVNDGENSILWISGRWPAELGDVNSVIGVTTPVWGRGGFVDADIQFNNVGFTWSTDGGRGTVDTQSIATHEQGHFLGLDHTGVQSAIMFASYAGGLKRTLGADDTNGVCALYPTGVALPDGGTNPDPCTSNNACDTCTPMNGCGWCTTSNRCLTGTANGPTGQSCGGQWNWQPSECSGAPTGNVPFGGVCTRSTDCANAGVCISDGTNAFCSSRCTTGCDCPSNYACLQTQTAGLAVCAPGTNQCAPDAGVGFPDATSPTDAGFTPPPADSGLVGPPIDGGAQPAGDSGVSPASDGGQSGSDGAMSSADAGSQASRNNSASRVRGGGCGCETSGGQPTSLGWASALLGLSLWASRRRSKGRISLRTS